MTQNSMSLPESSGKYDFEAREIQGDLESPIPLPKIDLRDSHAIRRELAAVYRDMRAGKLQTSDGTRLAYVLDMIRKAFETSELQARLELLEYTLRTRGVQE